VSIFDVIRYPISLPPTAEELAALPEDLYTYWIDFHTIDWSRVSEDTKYDRDHVARWMSRAYSTISKDEVSIDISKLKKLILEWDK
jgi:hypothetical protein